MINFKLEKTTDSDYMESYLLTITSAEFFKQYNKDKNLLQQELGYVLEMFCAPYCFEFELTDRGLEQMAEQLKECKSVSFEVDFDDGKYFLKAYFNLKKPIKFN